MIQMQYRKQSLEQNAWEVYGEATIITKDFRQFAKDLGRNEHAFYEWRYVDTKRNPEQAL